MILMDSQPLQCTTCDINCFLDGISCLSLPAGLCNEDKVVIRVILGDIIVHESKLRVEHFKNMKAFITLSETEDILWQNNEHVSVTVGTDGCMEIKRNPMNFMNIAIGPQELFYDEDAVVECPFTKEYSSMQ